MSDRPGESGEVTLAGKTYPFRIPKMAVMLRAMFELKQDASELAQVQTMIKTTVRWWQAAVGQEGWDDIARRLNDDNDELDWPELQTIFKEYQGKAAGRPTTSSSGSWPLLETTPTEAEPKNEESIFGI